MLVNWVKISYCQLLPAAVSFLVCRCKDKKVLSEFWLIINKVLRKKAKTFLIRNTVTMERTEGFFSGLCEFYGEL